MKADEARKKALIVLKRNNEKENEEQWKWIIKLIEENASKGKFTIDIPQREITKDLKKRLKMHGYKIYSVETSDPEEHLKYYRISWV